MGAPTAVLSYGSTALTLGERPTITRRADGFDDGRFVFHGGTETSLLPGVVVPGYSGMYVVSDRVQDDAGDLEHDVAAVGLRSGTTRMIEQEALDAEDGFDTGREVWLAVPSSSFRVGRVHSAHGNLRAVSVNKRSSPVSAYSTFEIQFKGIKTGNRPVREKIGVLSREVSREDMIINLPGGSSSAHNWNILLSEPTLQRSYLSLGKPNTSLVGLAFTPPNAPGVFGYSFSASDDTLTWKYPNGWVYAAVESDTIPDTTISFITEFYVRREKINLG